jgi:plasmid stabilization system protein ParE
MTVAYSSRKIADLRQIAAYFYNRDIDRIWRVAEGLEYDIAGICEILAICRRNRVDVVKRCLKLVEISARPTERNFSYLF